MGHQGRHAAAGATAQKVRRAAAVVLTAGALVSAGGHSAFADVLDGTPLNGQQNPDQDGEQNLDCGNSTSLIRLNLAKTVHQEKSCIDTDGHTRRHSDHPGGAKAVGGTTLGPQSNTAQTGKQNLHCGNSDDTLTVNVLGTIRKYTTCTAADHSHRPAPTTVHRGRAFAEAGQAVGSETNTAQNGRQNPTCGNAGTGIDLPLGQTKRKTWCTAQDNSGARAQ
jgi:hypothetical protein